MKPKNVVTESGREKGKNDLKKGEKAKSKRKRGWGRG